MVRLGFIGTGSATSVSDWHARGFLQDGRAQIAAVFNRTQAGSIAWARRLSLDIRVCASVEELLDRCDAVVICTPNYTHHSYAMAALAAGKHLLLEKPMTLSAAQAAELEAAAGQAQKHCTVGYVYRFARPVRSLREIVRERFGQIFTVHAGMGGSRLADPRVGMEWRMYAAQSGSGALHDFGSHLIDTAHFITGQRYSKVFCARETFIRQRPSDGGPEDVETDDSACLSLQGAGLGEFLVSRVGLGPMSLHIAGEGGMARLELCTKPLLTVWEKSRDGGYSGEEQTIALPQENVEDWARDQAADFLNGIEGKPVLGAGCSDGRYVDELLEAALRSAASGRAEELSGGGPRRHEQGVLKN